MILVVCCLTFGVFIFILAHLARLRWLWLINSSLVSYKPCLLETIIQIPYTYFVVAHVGMSYKNVF